MENIFSIMILYAVVKYLLFIILVTKDFKKDVLEVIFTFSMLPVGYWYAKDLLLAICIIETELILSNTILYINVAIIKSFAFKMLVSVTHNGILSKILCKLFNKKSLCKEMRRLQHLEYGPKLKQGIPAMANRIHKKTKVKFDGNGFPKFKSYYNIRLRRKDYKKTRENHFTYANKILYVKTLKSKKIRKLFTKNELYQLRNLKTPERYTWHHHQDTGKLQLVNRKIHSEVTHIGGYSIWGGENRI